jgi:cystathionine gamma-synthase
MSENPNYLKSVPVSPEWRDDSVAVQSGRPERVAGAPMSRAITLSSTYVHDAAVGYGRDGSETWGALEKALGDLDGGHAITFSSGLAAATAITSLIPKGGVVVIPNAAYYGVKQIFGALENQGVLTVRLVDGDKTEEVVKACEGAAMVWMESIANPTLVVADIPTIAAAAKKAGAISVVDATFATPVRQKPLSMGADIVLQSATKFIGGHSDLLLGAVITKSADYAVKMAAYRHDFGSVPGSLESFLALRGLRTLSVRVDRSESNAVELAKRLKAHPKVTKVNYPSLEGDSQNEKAKRVLPNGCGAMVSFELDGKPEQIDQLLSGLKLISHATSLGGVESLIERRTRYLVEAEAGVPMTLCRFSVGIENVEDIWADLDGAIKKVLG